jgi:hypothetical protein
MDEGNHPQQGGVSLRHGVRMKSLWAVPVLLIGTSLAMGGLQAKTPQAALEEIATADKPEVIAAHLPESIQKSIEELPRPQRRQVLDKLLSLKSERLDGCTIRRSADEDGWEIIDGDGGSAGRVKLRNVFISGLDALVSLELQSEDGSQMVIVAMHLEGNDWRIDDFGPWEKTNLHLPQLVHQPTQAEKNEAAAQTTLHTMVTALVSYALQYRWLGYPSRLGFLAGHAGEQPSAEHAALLDESFAAEPLIRDGYEFRYTLTRTGGAPLFPNALPMYEMVDAGSFQILATPVEFGRTGSRSYFINSNRMTSTSENRPATEDDPRVHDDDD